MKHLLLIGLIVMSGAALSETKSSTSTDSVSDKSMKKFGLSVGTFTLQTPNTKKGTDKLYGISIGGEREFNINNNGLSSSTQLSLGVGIDKTNDNETTDSYNDKYSSETKFSTLSLVQTINKRFDTSLGAFRTYLGAGLSRISMDSTSKSSYTDFSDPDYSWSDTGSSEYITYGKSLLLGADLQLKNGLLPFVSYQTTDFNAANIRFKSLNQDGTITKATFKMDAISIQTLTLGLGYRF